MWPTRRGDHDRSDDDGRDQQFSHEAVVPSGVPQPVRPVLGKDDEPVSGCIGDDLDEDDDTEGQPRKCGEGREQSGQDGSGESHPKASDSHVVGAAGARYWNSSTVRSMLRTGRPTALPTSCATPAEPVEHLPDRLVGIRQADARRKLDVVVPEVDHLDVGIPIAGDPGLPCIMAVRAPPPA